MGEISVSMHQLNQIRSDNSNTNASLHQGLGGCSVPRIIKGRGGQAYLVGACRRRRPGEGPGEGLGRRRARQVVAGRKKRPRESACARGRITEGIRNQVVPRTNAQIDLYVPGVLGRGRGRRGGCDPRPRRKGERDEERDEAVCLFVLILHERARQRCCCLSLVSF